MFRPDCERTFCDGYGKDQTLLEVMQDLDRRGYDLIHTREELLKRLKDKGVVF